MTKYSNFFSYILFWLQQYFFVFFYFSSDTEIHDTETRIETKKYTIDTHIYRFNIKHAWLFFHKVSKNIVTVGPCHERTYLSELQTANTPTFQVYSRTLYGVSSGY